MKIRIAAMALTAGAALLASAAPSLAKAEHARYSSAPVYTGAPALPTTLSMIVAGGGPSSFDSTKLVGVLAGDKTSAEVASLQKKFGADNVTSFLTVFNFVVNDSVAKVTAAKVALPTTPNPSPTDGKALAAALYTLGVDPSTKAFDVEYMLDGLVTHPIHVAVMDDIDAKYGKAADGNYHAVLTQAMMDLKSVYGL
ncbi:MAG: hypothetical protein IAI49_08590 [Candidatus Eremiobacteraeota bacterium]|nr:hypothetical protein [Candidatus Eremiobacteraeota bacterium]